MSSRTYSSPLRILLVDDEECIRHILGSMLRADGHTVAVAADGLDALGRFNAGDWDVVLTDRMMPRMDGEALASEVKRVSPSTPVIMVTGSVPLGLPSGVDAVIRKPFSREEIARAISMCVMSARESTGTGDGLSAAA